MTAGTTDLLLLRHPAVAAPPGLCYGQLDLPAALPLRPNGHQLVQRLRGWGALPATDGPRLQLVSSPLQRAWVLAQALAEALGDPWGQELGRSTQGSQLARPSPQPDGRWAELNFGQWEGQPWDSLPRDATDPWAADPWQLAPPGGETQAALHARVQAALHQACQQPGTLLIVSHAGPIRCALAVALGLRPDRLPELRLDFGSLTWLRWHPQPVPRWAVRGVNGVG